LISDLKVRWPDLQGQAVSPELEITYMSYYLAALKNYAGFSGRARRAEYWTFYLINIFVYIVLAVLASATDTKAFSYVALVYVLATFVPSLAVLVRRLHDTGKSGAWWFISFVPFIGGIWLLVFLPGGGNVGANSYGADAKAA